MLNSNYENNPNGDNQEVMKLRRLLTVLLSVSVVLAVVLVTLGFIKIINKINAPDGAENTPLFASFVTNPTTTTTEPIIYHTEQLVSSELADSYWRPLPELPEDQVIVPEHVEVKALYIGSGSALDKAIDLCNNSELNAIVIDLKNEYGLPYMSHV